MGSPRTGGQKRLSPFRVAWSVLDGSTRPLVAASAFVHLLERLALVAVAVAFSDTDALRRVDFLGMFFAAYVVRGLLRSVLTARAHVRLHDTAFEALLHGDLLRASVLDDVDTEGALLTGLDRGARLVGEACPQMLGDLVAAAVIVGYLVLHEPAELLLVVLVALSCAGASVLLARRWTFRAMDAAWTTYRPVLDGLVAAAVARLEIVGNGGAATFVAARRAEVRAWSRTAIRADRITSIAGRAPLFVGGALVVAALVADRGLRAGELTATSLGQAAIFASMLPAFAGLAWGAHEVTKASALFAPMAEILVRGRGETRLGGQVVTFPAEVAFEDVTFSYANAAEPALTSVGFAWAPRTVLVLRGENGSGKSTLMKLLLGVGQGDPASTMRGEVRVGGIPLASLDLAAWRRRIAYLPQRPYLLDRASVGSAISAIDDRPVDPAQAMKALAKVGLLETLERKAPGAPLSVLVGGLSSGERQRLALARALAAEKDVVLLDEPDANLDADGIERIVALVRELRSTCMVAVCAHTPDLIAVGDLVVHLERGAVAREPTP